MMGTSTAPNVAAVCVQAGVVAVCRLGRVPTNRQIAFFFVEHRGGVEGPTNSLESGEAASTVRPCAVGGGDAAGMLI